jgi:hypothetical protein
MHRSMPGAVIAARDTAGLCGRLVPAAAGQGTVAA